MDSQSLYGARKLQEQNHDKPPFYAFSILNLQTSLVDFCGISIKKWERVQWWMETELIGKPEIELVKNELDLGR